MIWEEFKANAPEIATLGEERFNRTGLVLLATLRKNGWPRISPVEVIIVDGHLYLGMMWQSMKALDLQRDPRCTVHSTVCNKDGSEGEVKLYGNSVEIHSLDRRSRFCDAVFAKIGWRPEEPEFHLFSIDIETAAYVGFEFEEKIHKIWPAKPTS
ncbi:MAG: pyridoxamine 5'-phosphate oxidase family protein [Chloroflexi bacterium]|nr:pyridoxamine 5'-phosphate oxidase family protein [Chloroflexota bacterium]